MYSTGSDRPGKSRTLLRVAMRHDVNPGRPIAGNRWVEVAGGRGTCRSLIARNGWRYRRPTMFLCKLHWQFDPGKGLILGAALPAGPVGPDTVPVTFAGHDGIYPRLNRSLPLGHDLWLMSMLHEYGHSIEQTTPPLPGVYVVLPDGGEINSLELNNALITDALMRVARNEDALQLERAPETMFASGDQDTHTVHVRYNDGAADTWVFPPGTRIKVPARGCEVAQDQIIAHVVPREGWRGLQAMTPEAMLAARCDIVDQFTCHDVLGQRGYDLRLFNGPLPIGTRVHLDTHAECEFLFDCSPTRLVGHIGMIHYNFLSNWYDRRIPVRRDTPRPTTRRPLTSPLMGAA